MDRPELRERVDTIIVKVYGMAEGATKRDGYEETVVRRATLEYAESEILALFDAELDNAKVRGLEAGKALERERIIDTMNAISAWTVETRQYRDMIIKEARKEE